MSPAADNARRVIDIGLDLLDRQLVDKDGMMAGKVDDLELTPPQSGSGPPVLTAILSGPGALGPRLGRLANRVVSFRFRLGRRTDPSRVAFGVVARITADVQLAVGRDEIDSFASEEWAMRIIARIPGAR